MIDALWPAIAILFAIGLTAGISLGLLLAKWTNIPFAWLLAAAAMTELVCVSALVLFGNRIDRRLQDLQLGASGETVVAESLQTLRADGYHILNDVPFDNTKENSPNIDHVLVGPGGIFTIETKTRSKRDKEQIVFDGERLTVGGRDFNEGAIGQTIGNAKRIETILKDVTGRTARSQPVLVFVGRWWIEDRRPPGQRDDIWVLNELSLIKWITNERPKLSPEDVALYATRLREYAQRA